MFKIVDSGSFKKTFSFLEHTRKMDIRSILDQYGRRGVEALSSVTPSDTGETAASWSYQINKKKGGWEISFHNSHIENGVSIAIILQYGHATGTGGYVEGIDYINPSIRPIFHEILDQVWREVNR